MNISACLVTRGNVDMTPIVRSLPPDWEVLVWDNGAGELTVKETPFGRDPFKVYHGVQDLSVYGRYAAIEYASHDIVYTQDDDVIVSDPQAIVRALVTRECPDCGALDHQSMTDGSWICHTCGCVEQLPDAVACNMPPEFRPHYPDSALVGFGAAFHRDAPEEAFSSFWSGVTEGVIPQVASDDFNRTCDVVFTTLTPRVLVDVPKTNLPYAEDADRMYRQATHVGERTRMLELARQVRDA